MTRPKNELLDRQPPRNLDAEWGVIGSMILDAKNVCDEMALVLREDDFYADAHQKLFHHLMALHNGGKPVDAVTLKAAICKAGDMEAIGGIAYLTEVIHSVPHAANAKYYAKLVQEQSVLRQMILAGGEILQQAYNATSDVEAVLSRAEQAVLAVRDRHAVDQTASISDVLIGIFERMDQPARTGVVASGYTDLDKLLGGGLHETELIILAARTGLGKSALAGNIADYVAVDCSGPVLMTSLEMSAGNLAERMLCARAQVDGYKLRSGFCSAADRQALVEASSKMADKPLVLDDTPSRTVNQIAALARRMKRKEGLRLLIVDYLQIIDSTDRRLPREQQVAGNTRALKTLARELSVPVLCLAQLNRQAADEKRPKLSQLRESGAIEQDADVVLFLHRDEAYQSAKEVDAAGSKGQADLIVAKQRNGPTGAVKLTWFNGQTRFAAAAVQGRYNEFDQWK